MHDDYQMSHDEQCTVGLIDVIRRVSPLATYGTKQDKDYWLVTQHRRMTSYHQPEKKDIVTFAKEISSNYDTLFSLMRDLPFKITIMEDLITKNISSAEWPHSVWAYIELREVDKTVPHEMHKQAVLSKMLVIGCNIPSLPKIRA